MRRPLPEKSPAIDLFRSPGYRIRRDRALHYPPPRLTEREMELVALVHCGLQDKEIAAALGLTWDSVKTRMSHIKSVLHPYFGKRPNRIELVLWWDRLPSESAAQPVIPSSS